MKVRPYNNRLLVEKAEFKEQKVGDIFIPEFAKDKKDIPKFMKVIVIDQSEIPKDVPNLVGKKIIIETGFLEEVSIDNKVYMFCPYNYVVCTLEE